MDLHRCYLGMICDFLVFLPEEDTVFSIKDLVYAISIDFYFLTTFLL